MQLVDAYRNYARTSSQYSSFISTTCRHRRNPVLSSPFVVRTIGTLSLSPFSFHSFLDLFCGIFQELYQQQPFSVLILALEDPKARVHLHGAAALINFCEGVERDTLFPYLDPIVERLSKLLNPRGDRPQVRRYVQEQAITTLAMFADASEALFAKHYASIMLLLLNVLQNAGGPTHINCVPRPWSVRDSLLPPLAVMYSDRMLPS